MRWQEMKKQKKRWMMMDRLGVESLVMKARKLQWWFDVRLAEVTGNSACYSPHVNHTLQRYGDREHIYTFKTSKLHNLYPAF